MRQVWKSDEQMRRLFPKVKFVGPPGARYTGSYVDMMVIDPPCPLTLSMIRRGYEWLMGFAVFPVYRCACPGCGFTAAILYGTRWRCKCGAEHAVDDTLTRRDADADR